MAPEHEQDQKPFTVLLLLCGQTDIQLVVRNAAEQGKGPSHACLVDKDAQGAFHAACRSWFLGEGARPVDWYTGSRLAPAQRIRRDGKKSAVYAGWDSGKNQPTMPQDWAWSGLANDGPGKLYAAKLHGLDLPVQPSVIIIFQTSRGEDPTKSQEPHAVGDLLALWCQQQFQGMTVVSNPSTIKSGQIAVVDFLTKGMKASDADESAPNQQALQVMIRALQSIVLPQGVGSVPVLIGAESGIPKYRDALPVLVRCFMKPSTIEMLSSSSGVDDAGVIRHDAPRPTPWVSSDVDVSTVGRYRNAIRLMEMLEQGDVFAAASFARRFFGHEEFTKTLMKTVSDLEHGRQTSPVWGKVPNLLTFMQKLWGDVALFAAFRAQMNWSSDRPADTLVSMATLMDALMHREVASVLSVTLKNGKPVIVGANNCMVYSDKKNGIFKGSALEREECKKSCEFRFKIKTGASVNPKDDGGNDKLINFLKNNATSRASGELLEFLWRHQDKLRVPRNGYIHGSLLDISVSFEKEWRGFLNVSTQATRFEVLSHPMVAPLFNGQAAVFWECALKVLLEEVRQEAAGWGMFDGGKSQ